MAQKVFLTDTAHSRGPPGCAATKPARPRSASYGAPQYIGSYMLLNARLPWQNADKDLSVSLEGTNLTNKYYYVTLFDLRAAGAGLDKAQPGRPREWAVTVKKTF